MAPSGAFAAKFVEVRVDRDLGLIRVARVVSVIDGGRILNEKLARSQIIGGTVGGIGQAIFEETITDAGTGRIANATFGDYLVPVNADVPDIDVVFVGGPDRADADRHQGHRRDRPGRHRRRRSPTRSTTPPAAGSAPCPSRSTSFSDSFTDRGGRPPTWGQLRSVRTYFENFSRPSMFLGPLMPSL